MHPMRHTGFFVHSVCVCVFLLHSSLILLWLRTRITVHAQTAALQQSNENFEARMSGKCGEWRDQFIMTLSLIH